METVAKYRVMIVNRDGTTFSETVRVPSYDAPPDYLANEACSVLDASRMLRHGPKVQAVAVHAFAPAARQFVDLTDAILNSSDFSGDCCPGCGAGPYEASDMCRHPRHCGKDSAPPAAQPTAEPAAAKPRHQALRTATVGDVKELLDAYDDDMPVIFGCDYGDHGHTRQAVAIKRDAHEVGLKKTCYSDSGYRILDPEYEDGVELDDDDTYVLLG